MTREEFERDILKMDRSPKTMKQRTDAQALLKKIADLVILAESNGCYVDIPGLQNVRVRFFDGQTGERSDNVILKNAAAKFGIGEDDDA